MLFVTSMLIVTLLPAGALGDVSFSAGVIVDQRPYDYVICVYADDLTGDGSMDLITASSEGDKVAWYRNAGNGSFEAQQVISTTAIGAWSVFAADLDGDDDKDILSASRDDHKITWYENLQSGSFGPSQIVSSDTRSPRSVYAADLDGDGVLDVLSASKEDDTVAWYPNFGNASFAAQRTVSTTSNGAASVFSADLNGDGLLDIISASTLDDKITWYANLGGGSFGPQRTISTSANAAVSVFAVDLDGDMDIDVLSASWDDDKIAWYENDGNGSFGQTHLVTNTARGASCVAAGDLDRDGDVDILSASSRDNTVAWYENRGSTGFSGPQVLSNSIVGACSVQAVDVDGDGDMDVIAGGFGGSIVWFEAITPSPPSTTTSFAPGAESTGSTYPQTASSIAGGQTHASTHSTLAWITSSSNVLDSSSHARADGTTSPASDPEVVPSNSKESGSSSVVVALITLLMTVLAALAITNFLWLRRQQGSSSNTRRSSTSSPASRARSPRRLDVQHPTSTPMQEFPSSSLYTAPLGNVPTPAYMPPEKKTRSSTAASTIRGDEIIKGKVLGEGQYGLVMKATWNEKDVAIKLVKGRNSEAMRQLRDEAQKLAIVSPHENVVCFYGICDDPFAVVIEFCDGGALVDKLYGGNSTHLDLLSDRFLLDIALGVAKGLSHLHHSGVIHRDVAARNILLHRNVAKLTDMGMSRLNTDKNGLTNYDQNTMTSVGPLKWMAPEQLNARAVSYKTDVYSYGILLIEMWSRSEPWPTETSVAAAANVMRGEVHPVPPQAPPSVSRVIQSSLRFDPRSRPAMLALAEGLGTPSQYHAPPPPSTH